MGDTFSERGHLEEICLFFCLNDWSAAFRTLAVYQLGFCPEAFAWCTVFSLILALVDITLVVQFLEDFLYSFNVIIIRCPDIAVITDVHIRPKALECFYDFVYIFLWGNAFFSGFLFDFQTVFIGTGEEHDIIALHPAVTSDGVASNRCIAMSDMRIAGRVINRGCDVIWFCCQWKSLLIC